MKIGGVTITNAMKRLIVVFSEKTTDRGTLDELYQLIGDKPRWKQAHDLFTRIRRKNIEATRRGDIRLRSQYCFEEACAKTIYNLPAAHTGRFDPDSPYWIIPNALVTAHYFGIDPNEIISAVVNTKPDLAATDDSTLSG
ncbi:MAG TPA: hypothetical protein VHZ30_04280 [Verrucomicrobiae bacterium]|jgi:hypothetical protein|nr:hypothetical protein [Verrucomicrobiae bacterium]